MKVVCVDDSNLYFKDEDLYYNRMDDDKPLLDKDVVYSVRHYNFTHYIGYVIDVDNKSWYYNINRFKELRLIREEKLQKLGI
jgi:hypothetical protein